MLIKKLYLDLTIMRWTKTDNRTEGDIRYVDRFLLFPVRIGSEVRWFERAILKQRRRRVIDPTCGYSGWSWDNIEFDNSNE